MKFTFHNEGLDKFKNSEDLDRIKGMIKKDIMMSHRFGKKNANSFEKILINIKIYFLTKYRFAIYISKLLF